MSVTTTSQKSVANLGWNEITLPAPLFAGDTLYAETKVIEKRLSKSKPNYGIITVETRGIKSDGTTVIKMKRSFMVAKTGEAVDDKAQY